MVCNSTPHINDVSLLLYKDFSEKILFKRHFHYFFNDGTNIVVEFREWGIYHLLAIQHINYKIKKDNFFNEIDSGLCFDDFRKENGMKARFRSQKERITMFSCLYQTLRVGNAFYLPSGKVKNTNDVSVDYLIFNIVDNKGMNVGIRFEDNAYILLTILISKANNQKKYLEDANLKLVRKLEITDENENILEEFTYIPISISE